MATDNRIESEQTSRPDKFALVKKVWRNRPLRYALGVTLGAGAGFAYWYFVGCSTGSCPIKSNVYYMTGFGAVMGFVATM